MILFKKVKAMKCLTLHCLASSLHRCQHSMNSWQNLHRTAPAHGFADTFVKAKTTKSFGFAVEIT
jgi:hypothetical protein